MMSKALLLTLVGVVVLGSAMGNLVEKSSFQPPFETYDTAGRRAIPNWTYGGSALANRHFVRLTPDRQSKRGWMWTNEPLVAPAWSSLLEFRVSGQGKHLYGDGFALWVTQSPRHVEGNLFGSADKFTGFVILFDTFRNTELGHVHKDVSVRVNDGSKNLLDDVPADPIGCNAGFRYHEGRDDFSVKNTSLVKVTYQRGKLTVKLDVYGIDYWQTCFETEVALPDGWDQRVYLGLSSSTGQLADNHDVLSMRTYRLDGTLQEAPGKEHKAKDDINLDAAEDLNSLVELFVKKHVKELVTQVEHLHEHLEHQLTAVNDNTQTTLKKLQAQDDQSVKRIAELEKRMTEVMSTALTQELNSRLTHLEDQMNVRIEQGKGSWMLPFALLTLGVSAVVYFGYRHYRTMLKKHLL